MPALPRPRGEITDLLVESLPREPRDLAAPALPDADDPLADEDLQLALYVCYELHYRGFDGVDERWEWAPSLIALRGELERRFERALEDSVGGPQEAPAAGEMDVVLRAISESEDGPSVSRFLEHEGGVEHMREFMIHRSAYQLKEADPHSWALPRLTGGPKAALVEIQADEYGDGRAERIHARLFADAMEALGLDSAYGAHLDRQPAATLATVNLMSLCGLHRRLRGAIVGHLALFEMTSSIPNRRYGDCLRRLGYGGGATEFFDEHVEADAVHESIAAVDLAGGLARQEPGLAADVVWGARALTELDRRWGEHLLASWSAGTSSLFGSGGASAAA